MEEKEVFTLSIKYKGGHLLAEIKTDMPVGPAPLRANYTIKIRRQEFVINPDLQNSDIPAWKLIEGLAEPKLVQLVGEAIERHYL